MLRMLDEKTYLNTLLKKHGNLTIEQLLCKFQYRSLEPIDQCRFECIFTHQNSANITPGLLNQFTGTIKEILQEVLLPQYNFQNLSSRILKISTLFENCGIITHLGENLDISIILYPIDRKVTLDEVHDYLVSLSAELSKVGNTQS